MSPFQFTAEALDDLESLRKFDQTRIIEAIELNLAHPPFEETKNRKRLRPNVLAEWELRVGTFRVFFDVDIGDALIKIIAIGYKKGNTLFVRGEEFEL